MLTKDPEFRRHELNCYQAVQDLDRLFDASGQCKDREAARKTLHAAKLACKAAARYVNSNRRFPISRGIQEASIRIGGLSANWVPDDRWSKAIFLTLGSFEFQDGEELRKLAQQA